MKIPCKEKSFLIMPKELKSSEQFEKLMPKAVELRVVREKDFVKLKLRTPDVLYTFKTNEDEADGILENAKDMQVVEFGKVKEKSEKSSEEKKEETTTTTKKKKKSS
jgi:hypothetical protein